MFFLQGCINVNLVMDEAKVPTENNVSNNESITEDQNNFPEDIVFTVFFDEGLGQTKIDDIGNSILDIDGVKNIEFVSADDAWESFKNEYFDDSEGAAEGFRDNQDNPLKNSAHYIVYIENSECAEYVYESLISLDGVRDVNSNYDIYGIIGK